MNNDPIYVERRKLWLEDLRTTTEPQTKHALHRLTRGHWTPGYCCLGRACEVAKTHGLEMKITEDSKADGNKVQSYDDSAERLPQSVVDWYGLTNEDELMDIDGNSAYQMNDNLGYTFQRIADALEPVIIP